MNSLAVALFGLLCVSVAMAGYPRGYYSTGHKTYLGGHSYGYRPSYSSYGHGLSYAKPLVHHAAPIVYAKSYAKPHVTYYSKPAYHPAPHGVVYSKPSYYLGGHSHGIGYKPISYGAHGYGYARRPAYYGKGYHH